MSANFVCRVCLVDDMNLYSVRNELQNVYERISKEKFNNAGYPVHMCYICLTVLRKCQRFVETAQDSNDVLKQFYNQQNEMSVARPLFTYSITKVEVTSSNADTSLQNDIKVEKVELEQEVQPEYAEYNTDVVIEKTDIKEQTDYSELLVDSPNNSTDTVEDNNDSQTDPLLINHEDFKDISNLILIINDHTNIETKIKIIPPHDDDFAIINNRKTIEIKPQHQAPETTGEAAVYSETSKDIATLNSSPSQFKENPTFVKECCSVKDTPKINKLVKSNIIKYKSKRQVRNTTSNRKNSNVLPPIIVKPGADTCNYKTTVQQHVTSRTDKKSFACNICNYKCTQKYRLKAHMAIHTSDKSFLCEICNYKCKLSRYLKKHMRTHADEKPLSCHICDYKCIKKSNLERHMRTHTGEKPFSCDICNYKCIVKVNMENHMRIHTGEKPFSCGICQIKFRQIQHLKTHKKRHTGDKPS